MSDNNTDWHSKIEGFLTGKLPPEEAEKMGQAIAQDDALAQEVALRRIEFKVAEHLIADQIRQQLAGLQSSRETPKPSPFWKSWWLLPIFAIALFVVFWQTKAEFSPSEKTTPVLPQHDPQDRNDQNIDPKQTDTLPVADHSNPLLNTPSKNNTDQANPTGIPSQKQIAMAKSMYGKPDLFVLRGSENSNQTIFEKALNLFEKNDCQGASILLAKVQSDDPQFWKSQTLLAHSFFCEGRYSAARKLFEQISTQKIQPFSEEADWYVLLAELAEGRHLPPRFYKQIDVIAADELHPFQAAASTLKKQLNKEK